MEASEEREQRGRGRPARWARRGGAGARPLGEVAARRGSLGEVAARRGSRAMIADGRIENTITFECVISGNCE